MAVNAAATHHPGPYAHNAIEQPAGRRIEILAADGVIVAEILNFDDFPCLDQHEDVEEKCKQLDATARATAALFAAAPGLLVLAKEHLADLRTIAMSDVSNDRWCGFCDRHIEGTVEHAADCQYGRALTIIADAGGW